MCDKCGIDPYPHGVSEVGGEVAGVVLVPFSCVSGRSCVGLLWVVPSLGIGSEALRDRSFAFTGGSRLDVRNGGRKIK